VIDARITDERLDAQAEFAAFLGRVAGDGAVASFVGIARPSASDGGSVTAMFLDHHPTLTQQSVADIASAAKDRFGASAVLAVHRYGEIAPGEAIVFVAASSPHRRAAFEAADYMMDRLKTEAIFWKREDTAGDSRWIEPTDTDHADRARWSDDGN
jgi:molybdopterin synthase catalytic subunit